MPGPEPRDPEPALGPDEEGEFLVDFDERPVDAGEPGVETGKDRPTDVPPNSVATPPPD